jgi:hypothetical protein
MPGIDLQRQSWQLRIQIRTANGISVIFSLAYSGVREDKMPFRFVRRLGNNQPKRSIEISKAGRLEKKNRDS